MNSRFYICLSSFGQRIKSVSRSEKLPLNNYFNVIHPGMPIIGRRNNLKPRLDFAEDCPDSIRSKILTLFQQAFK